MTHAQAPSLSALEKKFGFKSLGISTIKLSTPGFSATGTSAVGGEYTTLLDITCVTRQFQFANLRG